MTSPMTWTCRCGQRNAAEATACRACMASRPVDPLKVGVADEARYRSVASARALSVAADSVALYGRRFLSFITASLLMGLPLSLFHVWQLRTDQMVLPSVVGPALMGAVLLALWNVFWVILMIRVAAEEIAGVSEGLGEAVSRLSVSTLAWAVVAQFLVSLATGLASLLFIIPGIIVAVKLSLTLPAVVCEGLGPIAAMRRSSRLVKGHGWSVFGVLCLLFLTTLVASLALGGVLLVAKEPWMTVRTIFHLWTGGSNMLVRILLGPIWAIVPTLFYAAFRFRHDAVSPQPELSGTYGLMRPVASGSEQQ